MGKNQNKVVDLAALSPEELLKFAQEAQAKVAELETQLTEATEEKNTLKLEVANGTEAIGAAQTKLAELEAKVEKQTKDLEEVLNENAELQKALEEKPAANAKPTITHKKVKYQVEIPKFRHNGRIYAHEDLKTNPELIDELIKINSGVLKEVE